MILNELFVIFEFVWALGLSASQGSAFIAPRFHKRIWNSEKQPIYIHLLKKVGRRHHGN